MSYKVEDLGKNMMKLTIEATAEDFEVALEKAYQKNKNKLNVQGSVKEKLQDPLLKKCME